MVKWHGIVSLAVCAAIFGCSEKLEPIPEPFLQFPADTAKFIADTLTLTWMDTSAEVTSYTVQVSTSSSFSTFVVNWSCTTPYLAITSPPLANSTTYYWRVNASADKNRTSPWSRIFSFTTGVPMPELTTPGIDVVCVPDTLTLTWSSVAGATKYYVQVSTDAGFSTYAVNDSSLSPSFAVTSPLADSADFYWRVSVIKTQGLSAWSNPRKFTTALKLAAPALVSPANGAGSVASPVVLTWNPSAGTTMYHAQVSSSSDFASLAADADWLGDTTTTISSLLSGTQYWWRVAAKNLVCSSDGDWSAVWSFTTP